MGYQGTAVKVGERCWGASETVQTDEGLWRRRELGKNQREVGRNEGAETRGCSNVK